MKKSALCLLLCLLLALPCLSVAEQSRQVNRSCRIYFANGTELASRLNDGRLLTEVNGAEAVEHTFYIDPNGQTVDAVCVQYGEHILPYVVQAQDAQGDWQQIGAYTGDYAQGYAAFPARSQRFRLVFARDGEKLPLSLRQINVFTPGDTPAIEAREWQPSCEKADLLLIVAHPDDEARKSSKCNKDFAGRFPAEAFAGAVVEKINDHIQLRLGKRAKIRAFREKEPQQAVCVFVRPALPGLVRLGEVYRRAHVLLQQAELRKLRPVVQRNAPHRVPGQQPLHHLARLAGVPAGDFAGQQEPRAAIHQRHKQPLSNRAVYRIALKISQARAIPNRLRPFRNQPCRLDFGVMVHIMAVFAPAAQVFAGGNAWKRAAADRAVDGRGAQRLPRIFQAEAVGNRFGRPLALQLFQRVVVLG